MKPFFFVLIVSCHTALTAQDVVFTANHCISARQQRGSVEFQIDTVHHKGPFLVQFKHADGRMDTMPDFTGPFHIYKNLPPGQYCIDIQCCASCSASSCIDVLDYRQLLSGEVSVLWTSLKTPPETDSTAILLACTEFEEEDEVICSAVFSLYAPSGAQELPARDMIEKALDSIREIGRNEYPENEENGPDAWIEEPFKLLFRFDADGQIRWVYPEW